MNSTMTRTAPAVDTRSSEMPSSSLSTTGSRLRLRSVAADTVVLPAAVAAPAALVIAVDAPVSQETSVLAQAFVAPAGYAVAPNAAAPIAHVQKARTQGPPSRGTPV